MHVQTHLKSLRTAIPYIRAYKGRIFVIKLSGRLCEPGPRLDNIADQISLLHQLRIRVLVVHGGGEQVDALSQRLGLRPRRFAGRRITGDEDLEAVQMALAGTVNTNLVAALRRAGVSAAGLTGVDAELLLARRRPTQECTDPGTGETRRVDFGHVGDLIDVCPRVLLRLLDDEVVPVVCPLAADASGDVLNVNADTAAARIAAAVQADKYFLLSNVDGVMRDVGDAATLVSLMDLRELEELVASGAITGGMLPKLASCEAALLGGVPKVHVINGCSPDTLLAEVFTNEGCGTLIVERKGAHSGIAAATPASGSLA